ncbi:MAG: hypothetical protein ACYTGN_00535 [Planctomycetota bacterium]|jgi:hypothetical protein
MLRRCPERHVLIVYGKVGGGDPFRIKRAGRHVVWPVIQDSALLDLAPVDVDGYTVAVRDNAEGLRNAATHILRTENIAPVAQKVLAAGGDAEAELAKVGLELR